MYRLAPVVRKCQFEKDRSLSCSLLTLFLITLFCGAALMNVCKFVSEGWEFRLFRDYAGFPKSLEVVGVQGVKSFICVCGEIDVRRASRWQTPFVMLAKHCGECELPVLRYFKAWFGFRWTAKLSSPAVVQLIFMSRNGNVGVL